MGIKSRIDQCKIVWYQWKNKISTSDFGALSTLQSSFVSEDLISEAEAFDISDHIIDCTFTKNMEDAAGSFIFTLSNSMDWARFIQPGEWISIFLSNDGSLPSPGAYKPPKPPALDDRKVRFVNTKKIDTTFLQKNINVPPLPKPNVALATMGDNLRCFGIVERVGIRSIVNASGAKEITYVVSGKDFGVCLEDTDLWLNFFFMQKSYFKAVVDNFITTEDRNLKQYITKVFNVFFSPVNTALKSEVIAPNQQLLEHFKQWILPSALLDDLGITYTGQPYFGNLANLLAFSDTRFEVPVTTPLAGLEGSPWETLKELSEPSFHEFFCEIIKGQPKVVFRPIPWAINKNDYPNLGQFIPKYIDLFSGQSNSSIGSPVKEPLLFTSVNPLDNNPLSDITGDLNVYLKQEEHPINLTSDDIFSFDTGPDFHNRYNHFLVTNSNDRSFSLIHEIAKIQRGTANFPFKNEISKKRHGLRKKHILTNAFLVTTVDGKVKKNDPNVEFLIECNAVLKDYWGFAENFYSGSFSIAGSPEVRLGKVIITPLDLSGMANMLFYLEQYTDSFSISENGVGAWTQELSVTRGIEISDLDGATNFSDKNAIDKTGSFIKKS